MILQQYHTTFLWSIEFLSLSRRTTRNFSQVSCTSCQFSLSADDLASRFIESRGNQKITFRIPSTASTHWLHLCSNTLLSLLWLFDDWSVLLSKPSSFTYALDLSLFTSQGRSSRNPPFIHLLNHFSLFLLDRSYQPANILLVSPST